MMIGGAVLLAVICWAFTFGLAWGNFWVKIGLSVVLICAYSFYWQKPKINFSLRSVFLGILSAVVLYGIFYLGFVLSPYIVPGATSQVGGIYGMGINTDARLIFLLLLFVTGPGEEIFWRGFLQERLMGKYGNVAGFVITTIIYGSIHIFSLNFMLTMAAYVAGAFWGALYLWKRDLTMVIVSHSLWSAVIFAIFPVH
jgi:membrane protease YdiL (CAAX protease family)